MRTPSTDPRSTVATFTTVPIPVNKRGLPSAAETAGAVAAAAALQATAEALLLRGMSVSAHSVHLGGGSDRRADVAPAIKVRDARPGDAETLITLWREMSLGTGHH